MEMTKEQVYQWLREVKQNKENTIEQMKKVLADEYKKETGINATYIEAI